MMQKIPVCDPARTSTTAIATTSAIDTGRKVVIHIIKGRLAQSLLQCSS